MKKLISIALLVILFINIAGYHFMFYLQRWEIRAAMKQELYQHVNDKESEQFVFLLNEKDATEKPEWKDNDEFEFKGEMYDVTEKKTVEGKTVVRAINDKKETQLVKKYLAMSKDDFGNSSRKKAITLLTLINGLYINPETTDNTLIVPLKPDYFFHYKCSIPASGSDVLTPPPQVS